jgi:membrane associated rhomboid family serine protease
MSSFLERLKYNFQQQGILAQIIIINVAIFLTLNLVGNLSHLYLTPFVALPIGGTDFIFKFWTLFTYMFTHEGLGHIFWNMFLLYFTAQIFFTILGQKKLLYVYVMSGISGGALVLILGLLFPDAFGNALLLGASAAVLGVGAVMAVYAPNYRVYLWGIVEMPYKYFYLLTFGVSTIIDLSVNTGGKISHIGGALFGLLYGYQLKKGIDLFDFAFLKRKKSKLKVVSYNPNVKKDSAVVNEEATMNSLLDKISKSGYDSLTKAEKDLLFKLSQKK